MRYAKVYSAIWSDRQFMELPDDAKVLYIYIVSCEHGNEIGLFRLSAGYIYDDIGFDIQKARKLMAILAKSNLVLFDETAKMAFIPSFLKWNKIQAENNLKGAALRFDELPPSGLDSLFFDAMREHCPELESFIKRSIQPKNNHIRTGLEPPSNEVRTTFEPPLNQVLTHEQENKQENEQEQESKRCPEQPKTSVSGLPPVFTLPSLGGDEYQISPALAQQYSEAFPALDILGELKRMKVWLESHPKNAKKNIPSFMVRWLSRAQEKSGSIPQSSQKPRRTTVSEDFAGEKTGDITDRVFGKGGQS